MKSILILFGMISSLAMGEAPDEARVIELKTEKIADAVHWTPKEIEVSQGEKVKFVAKHELEGGFDFHGLLIGPLKVSEQVHRHTPMQTKVITVPISMKPGKYPIGCQFHPKHVPATLIVKAK